MHTLIKRIAGFSLFLLLITMSSCELDPNCKDCYIVTYKPDGSVQSSVFDAEYCDQALDEIEGKDETDPQGFRSVYECE